MFTHKGKKSSRGRTARSFAVLAVVAAAAGIVFSGWGGTSASLSATKDGGDARLVAFHPLPEAEGLLCQFMPPNATTPLSAALIPPASPRVTAAQAAAEPRPSEAARTAISRRPPVRQIRDSGVGFSGVAIDLKNDEVVLTDENNFSILTFDRLENTPPTARMSEPKRMIHGPEAYLEYNCSVYVDPKNGDIFSVNNDTLNWLTVFNRDVKGNMPPTRKLYAPHTVFGIAVDEQNQEIFLAEQDDHAVVVFKKTAKDHESPIRVLQGKRTMLADPHGIAIDSQAGLIYVTNWGSSSDRPPLGDPAVKLPRIGRVQRTLWPVEREYTIRGSGKIAPPSITVYSKGASGDTPPLRVIQGPKTQMNWPTAIAVDPEHGELFVANDTADLVTVYKTDATGDAAPIRVLKGPKTMIKNPTGIAYDAKHDELWVANFGSHAATVFKRTASGDVAPLRVIRSAPAGTPAPMMGNPHTMAFDSKRDQILVSN